MFHRGVLILAACSLGLCIDAAAAAMQIDGVDYPSGPGAGEPFLVSDGEAVYMSWLEPEGEGHALRFARWDGRSWSAPRTIAAGNRFFVNWADFPSLLPLTDGKLVAHWPEYSADETYSYDVMMSWSRDSGATWSEPTRPHDDGTPTEHGFVSMLPEPSGGVSLVWLDGRAFHGEDATREMALRFASHDGSGFVREAMLDERVCDCCQTAAVRTSSGLFVAYRDRSEEEIRDISYVRLAGDGWTQPRPLHRDGWKIPACPVNGPAAVARGNRVFVAWFTGAGGAGGKQVLAALSEDGGATFEDPIRIDDGRPAGRVDLALLDARRALVSWLERTGDGEADLRVRVLRADGETGPSVRVASGSAARSSGFPRMARLGTATLIAWTGERGIELRRIGEEAGK